MSNPYYEKSLHDVCDSVYYLLEHYKVDPATGTPKLFESESYDNYDSAWVNTVGPVRVSQAPACDYSTITEVFVFRHPSGSYDFPDDFSEMSKRKEYFTD